MEPSRNITDVEKKEFQLFFQAVQGDINTAAYAFIRKQGLISKNIQTSDQMRNDYISFTSKDILLIKQNSKYYEKSSLGLRTHKALASAIANFQAKPKLSMLYSKEVDEIIKRYDQKFLETTPEAVQDDIDKVRDNLTVEQVDSLNQEVQFSCQLTNDTAVYVTDPEQKQQNILDMILDDQLLQMGLHMDNYITYTHKRVVPPIPRFADQLTPNSEAYSDGSIQPIQLPAGRELLQKLITVCRSMAGIVKKPLHDILFESFQGIGAIISIIGAHNENELYAQYMGLTHKQVEHAVQHLAVPWCQDMIAFYIYRMIVLIHMQFRHVIDGVSFLLKPDILASEITGFMDQPTSMQTNEAFQLYSKWIVSNQWAIQSKCEAIAAEAANLYIPLGDSQPTLTGWWQQQDAKLFDVSVNGLKVGQEQILHATYTCFAIYKLRNILAQMNHSQTLSVSTTQASDTIQKLKINHKTRRWQDCTIISHLVYAQRKLASFLFLDQDKLQIISQMKPRSHPYITQDLSEAVFQFREQSVAGEFTKPTAAAYQLMSIINDSQQRQSDIFEFTHKLFKEVVNAQQTIYNQEVTLRRPFRSFQIGYDEKSLQSQQKKISNMMYALTVNDQYFAMSDLTYQRMGIYYYAVVLYRKVYQPQVFMMHVDDFQSRPYFVGPENTILQANLYHFKLNDLSSLYAYQTIIHYSLAAAAPISEVWQLTLNSRENLPSFKSLIPIDQLKNKDTDIKILEDAKNVFFSDLGVPMKVGERNEMETDQDGETSTVKDVLDEIDADFQEYVIVSIDQSLKNDTRVEDRIIAFTKRNRSFFHLAVLKKIFVVPEASHKNVKDQIDEEEQDVPIEQTQPIKKKPDRTQEKLDLLEKVKNMGKKAKKKFLEQIKEAISDTANHVLQQQAEETVQQIDRSSQEGQQKAKEITSIANSDDTFEEIKANYENFALSQSDISYYQNMFSLCYQALIVDQLQSSSSFISEAGIDVFTQSYFLKFTNKYTEYFISLKLFQQPETLREFNATRIKSYQIAALWSAYEAFSIRSAQLSGLQFDVPVVLTTEQQLEIQRTEKQIVERVKQDMKREYDIAIDKLQETEKLHRDTESKLRSQVDSISKQLTEARRGLENDKKLSEDQNKQVLLLEERLTKTTSDYTKATKSLAINAQQIQQLNKSIIQEKDQYATLSQSVVAESRVKIEEANAKYVYAQKQNMVLAETQQWYVNFKRMINSDLPNRPQFITRELNKINEFLKAQLVDIEEEAAKVEARLPNNMKSKKKLKAAYQPRTLTSKVRIQMLEIYRDRQNQIFKEMQTIISSHQKADVMLSKQVSASIREQAVRLELKAIELMKEMQNLNSDIESGTERTQEEYLNFNKAQTQVQQKIIELGLENSVLQKQLTTEEMNKRSFKELETFNLLEPLTMEPRDTGVTRSAQDATGSLAETPNLKGTRDLESKYEQQRAKLSVYNQMAAAAPPPKINSINVTAFMTTQGLSNPWAFCGMQQRLRNQEYAIPINDIITPDFNMMMPVYLPSERKGILRRSELYINIYNQFLNDAGKDLLLPSDYLTEGGQYLQFIIVDLPTVEQVPIYIKTFNEWEKKTQQITEASIFVNTNRDLSVIEPIYMPLQPNASAVTWLKEVESTNKTEEQKVQIIQQVMSNAQNSETKGKQARITSKYTGSLFRHVYESVLGKKNVDKYSRPMEKVLMTRVTPTSNIQI